MNDSTRPPWTTPSGQKTSRRQSHRSRSKTSGRRKQGRYQHSAPHTAQRQRMQQMRKPHSEPPTMRFPSNMVSGGKPLTTSTDNNHQCAGHPLGAFFDPPARFFCIWEKCDAQGKSVFATPPPPAHSPAPNYSPLPAAAAAVTSSGATPRQGMGRVVSEIDPKRSRFPQQVKS